MKIKDFSLFSSKMSPNRWKKSNFQKFLISHNYILYELVAYQKLLVSVHWRKSVFKKTFCDFQYVFDFWNNLSNKILDFYDENLGKIQNFRNLTNFDEL